MIIVPPPFRPLCCCSCTSTTRQPPQPPSAQTHHGFPLLGGGPYPELWVIVSLLGPQRAAWRPRGAPTPVRKAIGVVFPAIDSVSLAPATLGPRCVNKGFV